MAILGILIAIAVIIFLALLERWRVDTATRQLVGDLRLAHSSATNELEDWRVVLALDRGEQEEGPDYYLVRLAEPYGPGDARPTSDKRLSRTFPGNVKVTNVITPSGSLVDDPGANYWVSPWDTLPSPPTPQTRTLEFNTDGTMTFFRSPSGSACVTVDTLPHKCRTSCTEIPCPTDRRSLEGGAGTGLGGTLLLDSRNFACGVFSEARIQNPA